MADNLGVQGTSCFGDMEAMLRAWWDVHRSPRLDRSSSPRLKQAPRDDPLMQRLRRPMSPAAIKSPWLQNPSCKHHRSTPSVYLRHAHPPWISRRIQSLIRAGMSVKFTSMGRFARMRSGTRSLRQYVQRRSSGRLIHWRFKSGIGKATIP